MHAMPLNWQNLFAANLSAWKPCLHLRTLLRKESAPPEAAIGKSPSVTRPRALPATPAERLHQGVKGNMVLVPISAQDERKRRMILSTVLPRWR